MIDDKKNLFELIKIQGYLEYSQLVNELDNDIEFSDEQMIALVNIFEDMGFTVKNKPV